MELVCGSCPVYPCLPRVAYEWCAFDLLLFMNSADSDSVIGFSNTISFDVHTLQWMPAFYAGCCLAIAKPKGHLDPEYMCSFIIDNQITSMMFTVPTLVRTVVQVDCSMRLLLSSLCVILVSLLVCLDAGF